MSLLQVCPSGAGEVRILYVMATAAELGPELRRRIDPLICGVGPVESAISVTASLAQRAIEGCLPQLVISLGSAGSRSLAHTGIYQVGQVSYRDIDASALGFEKGTTPFADHPAVIDLPYRLAGIPVASLATGGAVVSGTGYEAIAADMVDMETFAIHRAAARFGVPMLGLRGISDGQAPLQRYADWSEYLPIIDAGLSAILDDFLEDLRTGRFSL